MSRATSVSETPQRSAMISPWSMKRSALFWKTTRPAIKQQLLKPMLSQSHSIVIRVAACDAHDGGFMRSASRQVWFANSEARSSWSCLGLPLLWMEESSWNMESSCLSSMLACAFVQIFVFSMFLETSSLGAAPARSFKPQQILVTNVVSNPSEQLYYHSLYSLLTCTLPHSLKDTH